MTPTELYALVSGAWSAASCPTPFEADKPAKNQCAVTALAFQRLLGGEIVKTRTAGGTHFYNRLDGTYWDLTVEQFDQPIPYENLPSDAAEAHEHASPAQLDALLADIAARAKQKDAA